MSERGYFSHRWAIPGYVFILIVVVLNYIPLWEILKRTEMKELFGALFAFLALLTGSALGFLVTQGYWWWFNRNGGIIALRHFEKAESLPSRLTNKYEYTPPVDEKEKRLLATAVLDFAAYMGTQEFLGYIWRRWDMYHLLSCVYHTIGAGLFVGLLCRIFSEYSLFGFKCDFNSFNLKLSQGAPEFWGLVIILAGTILLLLVVRGSRLSILASLRPTWEAIIRHNLQNKDDALENAFPEYFKRAHAL